jgi:uncharacterized membrane protein YdjX (TVP38/TMEM64 family)
MRKPACLGLLLLLGCVFVVLLSLLPLQDSFKQYYQDFLEWIRDLGALGPFVLMVAYALAALLLIPGSALTMGAGFVFGIVPGFLTVLVGANLGASCAFGLGRTLGRRWLERRLASDRRFQAIDQAIGRQAFKIVLLLRLSPVIPYTLINYGLSLTRVSYRDFALATLVGMLPGALMYVYLGSAVKNLADIFTHPGQRNLGQEVFFFVGLTATVLVTILLTRMARQALAAAVPPAESTCCHPGGDDSPLSRAGRGDSEERRPL